MSRSVAFLIVILFPLVALAQQPFSYQGYLEHGGDPADGDHDFQFTLYDDPAKGLQVGPVESRMLTPENGVFSVILDFGSVFDGTALWLETKVRRHGIGSYETLSPRAAISPAPYAYYSYSSPFDLPYSGSTAFVGSAFDVSNSSTVGQSMGLSGSTVSTTNGSAGVYGLAGKEATSTLSVGPGGVVGSSRDEFGVIGHSTNSIGVFGLSQAGNSVYGLALAGGTAHAVYGLSHGSGNGVRARSTTTGDALYAIADGTGKAAVIDGLLSVGSAAHNGRLEVYDDAQAGIEAGTSEKHASNGSGISIRDDEGETVVYAGVGSSAQGGRVQVVSDGDNYSSNYAALIGNYSGSGSAGLFVSGTGSSMSLQGEFTGDDAVNFPANAISQFEIEGEVGFANVIQGPLAIDIGDTPTTILSRTITAPTTGYVVAIASSTIRVMGAGEYPYSCVVGISTSSSSVPASQDFLLYLQPDGTSYHPITVHGVFSVTPGSTTFYLLASGDDAFTFYAEEANLTLLFIPTSYGTVVSTDVISTVIGDEPGSRSGLTPAEISAERSQSVQDNSRRIQNELDEIRRRVAELEEQIAPETSSPAQ